MLTIDINTVDIARLANLIGAAGDKAPLAIRRALKHTGDRTTTAVKKALVPQTGLKPRVIHNAVKGSMSGGALAYEIRSKGGDISLKYFSPKETRAGVKHTSKRQPSPLAGSFTRGGKFPRRVPLPALNGHVFKRAGAGRLPIVKQKSGVIIPAEMVRDASRAAFFSTVQSRLPDRLAHELYRILGVR